MSGLAYANGYKSTRCLAGMEALAPINGMPQLGEALSKEAVDAFIAFRAKVIPVEGVYPSGKVANGNDRSFAGTKRNIANRIRGIEYDMHGPGNRPKVVAQVIRGKERVDAFLARLNEAYEKVSGEQALGVTRQIQNAITNVVMGGVFAASPYTRFFAVGNMYLLLGQVAGAIRTRDWFGDRYAPRNFFATAKPGSWTFHSTDIMVADALVKSALQNSPDRAAAAVAQIYNDARYIMHRYQNDTLVRFDQLMGVDEKTGEPYIILSVRHTSEPPQYPMPDKPRKTLQVRWKELLDGVWAPKPAPGLVPVPGQ